MPAQGAGCPDCSLCFANLQELLCSWLQCTSHGAAAGVGVPGPNGGVLFGGCRCPDVCMRRHGLAAQRGQHSVQGRWAPTCHHALQLHEIWVLARLQHPQLAHRGDWHACMGFEANRMGHAHTPHMHAHPAWPARAFPDGFAKQPDAVSRCWGAQQPAARGRGGPPLPTAAAVRRTVPLPLHAQLLESHQLAGALVPRLVCVTARRGGPRLAGQIELCLKTKDLGGLRHSPPPHYAPLTPPRTPRHHHHHSQTIPNVPSPMRLIFS